MRAASEPVETLTKLTHLLGFAGIFIFTQQARYMRYLIGNRSCQCALTKNQIKTLINFPH
jgi:hypothetical protein